MAQFVATDHDPGADRAAARVDELEASAAEPFELDGGARILVGTASWTDPTMTAAGVFYPAGADSAEERLQYYASTFPVVEVDATYYALPAEQTAQLWVDRTPPDFTFDIKAHALMTGQGTETKRLPKAIREALPDDLKAKSRIYAKDLPEELKDEVWSIFRQGLAPLVERGQLGSILLQYPKWVFPSSENRALIEEAVVRLEGWTCAVEFRNGSWLNEKNAERTTRFLAERNIPFVMVDEPQGFKSSVPPEVLVTSSDLALVRFHGRNAETWEKKGITPAERFRYLYSRDELTEWVPRIKEAAAEAKEVHLMFNNCYANYGTTNAREIAALLLDLETADA
ncbi:MAG TPA: DUF72 domain-containing protein [Candidatus Limnocylindrales bacterium]|nr:DUF72 domain-containing protein [Candidatus Limnocylindrales bacterium]